MVLRNTAWAHHDGENYRQALTLYNQVLPIFRDIGDRWGEAVVLYSIGLAYDALDDLRQALTFYNQALPIYQELGDQEGVSEIQRHINEVYNYLGI